MNISFNWLNDFLDLEEFRSKPVEIDKLLTKAGLEVEGIEDQATKYNNVVVGQIKELVKHPNADKLTVCQVDVGTEVTQIVCGAKNHKQGDFVVVTMPGAVLPGDFKIKKSKIRDVESNGMLASEKELGLTSDADGIMILEKGKSGEEFSKVFNLDDIIFDISVTPNRADCLSHLGLARELSCLTGKKLNTKTPKLKASKISTKQHVRLDVIDKKLCPRYAGRIVKGITVKDSPAWLKLKLESVGLNSINNIVDITNFILMEYGQPMHAFDLSNIKGKKIRVDTSLKNEKFTTLDGTEIKLTGEELVIRDGEGPVALAGVIGGLNSGVTEETTDIFLESAYFAAESVRKTSRKFGIDTDSSYRFSRGTDPSQVVEVLSRACELVAELAGGEVADDFYDEYKVAIKPQKIKIALEFVEQKIGYPIKPKDFEAWMNKLGCTVAKQKEFYVIEPPLYRWDLNYDVDIIEEYARLNGYDKILEILPELNHNPTAHDKNYIWQRNMEELLTAQGYLQAYNYHFSNSEYQKNFVEDSKNIELLNPISEDLNVMRKSLMPGLINNLLTNYRKNNFYGRLYELGTVFDSKDGSYDQSERLSFISWGQKKDLWQNQSKTPVVFEIKSTVENILNGLNVSSFSWEKMEDIPGFVHPGRAMAVKVEGQVLGYIGELHPGLCEEYKIRHNVALFDLDFSKLVSKLPRKVKFKKISKYPSVERDFSFVVAENVDVNAILRDIKKAVGNSLKSVEIFDIFKGKGIEPGNQSMSFKLLLQDMEKTFNEEELTKIQKNVTQTLEKKYSVQIR